MTQQAPPLEYLVISRGKWHADLAPEVIQEAIDRFYEWHGKHVDAGTMKAGQRLASEGRLVTSDRVIDGPFSEAKEVVGGYWFILAASLDEAAQMAAGNPCLACGLSYEIRPLEPEKASAFAITNETPLKISAEGVVYPRVSTKNREPGK